MSNMQQDPFAPKYGNVPVPPQPVPTYGGLPVQPPKKGLNMLLIPLILSILFLIGAVSFAAWAFMGMQDYKDNVQPKIDKAVAIAKQETGTAKDAEFLEKEKNPLREYKTSQDVGSISVVYPKTWSGFVTESSTASNPVEGYFYPGVVPGLESGTDFALRVRVLTGTYADYMKQVESNLEGGKITVSPYKLPKMPDGPTGARLEGEVNPGQQDTVVVFPLRDKTIEISTESNQFKGDFDKIILANLTFSP